MTFKVCTSWLPVVSYSFRTCENGFSQPLACRITEMQQKMQHYWNTSEGLTEVERETFLTPVDTAASSTAGLLSHWMFSLCVAPVTCLSSFTQTLYTMYVWWIWENICTTCQKEETQETHKKFCCVQMPMVMMLEWAGVDGGWRSPLLHNASGPCGAWPPRSSRPQHTGLPAAGCLVSRPPLACWGTPTSWPADLWMLGHEHRDRERDISVCFSLQT